MSPPDNCWFPWHLPMRKAKEMIFTGDPLTGKQAAEYGLANYSVPADELEAFTTKLAERVALVPPMLLALSKRQINRTYEVMGIRTALSAGNDIMGLNTGSTPFIDKLRTEGLRSALDERARTWGPYGPSPLAPDA
jgi:enoyl-CoA hydratase